MKIALREVGVGRVLAVATNGPAVLVQTDLDFAGLVPTFGWFPCRCGATDGTVAGRRGRAGSLHLKWVRRSVPAPQARGEEARE
jgi:hypothetical protein